MNEKIKTKTIRQTASFDATPHRIYEMLMDSKLHSAFTGDEAKISRKVGGKFTTFSGWSYGKNLELVKDRKIVQSWRGDDWPKGHYSTVTFKLSRQGNGTKLEFIQTDVPESQYRDVSDGWKEYYWEKMKGFLDSGR